MVWLLLSWLAVGVVVAVGFGMLAHRAEAAGDPLAPTETSPTGTSRVSGTADTYAADQAVPGRADRAAA